MRELNQGRRGSRGTPRETLAEQRAIEFVLVRARPFLHEIDRHGQAQPPNRSLGNSMKKPARWAPKDLVTIESCRRRT